MSFKELFFNYPVVRQLSILQLIAYFGAWFSNVAIYTMLVEFGTGDFAIAVVAAMHWIPAVIIAPFSGVIIDKFRIKPLMLTLLCIELIMTLMFLTITDKSMLWLLLILVFIRMGSSAMLFTAEMSLLPKLVTGEALQMANAVHSIIWSFTFALGMALGGIVVNSYGVKTAIVIDSLFFIIAIILFANIKFNVDITQTKEKFWEMLKDGFLYIKNNKIALHLILLHSSVGLISFDALITLLAKNEYKYVIAVPLAIGITNTARAIALMIGPFFLKNCTKERLLYLFIFQGISIMVWGLFQFNFYFGLVAAFFTGIVVTTIWSVTYSFLQERVEQKYLGRVVSYNDMVFMLANVLTTFFIGIAAGFTSLNIITIIIGSFFIFVAIYYKSLLKFL